MTFWREPHPGLELALLCLILVSLIVHTATGR